MKRSRLSEEIIKLHNLAARYGAGDGIRKNRMKARQLYHKAAKLGSRHAYYELGMSYLCDKPKAVEGGLYWIRRAANRALSDAQELLGDIYAQGMFGKKRNRHVALIWYRKAVTNGNKRARQAIADLEKDKGA